MAILKKIQERLKVSDKHRVSQHIVDKLIADENFPYLVSFPRTGSHWLRLIMELCFEKPSLVRIFYYPDAKDFTCYHTHDQNITVKRKNVIYLYRQPAPVIFSQINYYHEDPNDIIRIKYWATLYGLHLEKWLLLDKFTQKKTVITYENMKNNLEREFKKVANHLGYNLDSSKLKTVANRISKDEVSKKTKHDKQVVSLDKDYQNLRQEFINHNQDQINNIILTVNHNLKEFL